MRHIYNNGEAVFALADGEKVAVFSDSSVNFYIQTGRPNAPNQWKLIETVAPGAVWVSGPSDGPSVCRLQASEAIVNFDTGPSPQAGSVLWGTVGGSIAANTRPASFSIQP